MSDDDILVPEDLYKVLRRIGSARRLDRALLRDIEFDPDQFVSFVAETGFVPREADLDRIREALGAPGRPLSEIGPEWKELAIAEGVGRMLLRSLAAGVVTIGLGVFALARRRSAAAAAEAEAVASVAAED